MKRPRFILKANALCCAVLAVFLVTLPVQASNPGEFSAESAVPSSFLAANSPTSQPCGLPSNQTPPASAEQGVRFERISTADGLSQSSVNMILQDRQGFMWFATDSEGLNKYDGYQFTVLKNDPNNPDTLSNDNLETIYEDRSGDLWVGTVSGLDRFDRVSGAFTHYQNDPNDPTSLSVGSVEVIYEDSTGTFWVGTSAGGLDRFDRTTQTFSRFGAISERAFVIFEDQSQNLWVGTQEGLIRFDLTSNSIDRYRHNADDARSLSAGAVTTIFEDHEGALWVGTNGGGLDRMDRSSGTFYHYRHKVDDPHSLGDDRVSAILEDRAGRLWVGTAGGGLNELDRDQDRFLHHRYSPFDPHSLSDDAVTAIFEDRSGVLWVGTNGGISKYSPLAIHFTQYHQRLDIAPGSPSLPAASYATGSDEPLLSHPYVLSDDFVTAVYEDGDDVLWVGTLNGGLNRLDRSSGNVTAYQTDPADSTSLRHNYVSGLYQDRDGRLWVGTDAGLDLFDPQEGRFYHQDHVSGTRVTAVVRDQTGDLWAGTFGRGLFRSQGANQAPIRYQNDSKDPFSLGSNLVYAIHEDRTGRLWFGTIGGGINVWERSNDRFTHYVHDPGNPQSLSHDWVISFYEDLAGVVWVGTWGGGLNRFDPATQTFTHYTEKDGLPNNTVACILGDSTGFLWLGTFRGLSRFDPRTESFRNYGVRDGLQSEELWSCFQGERGEMFFGGNRGLVAFYPDQVKENPRAPPIVITAFYKFNRAERRDLSADEHIQLAYDDNFVSFDFAALDYTAPEKNRYAYMLEGLDKGWVFAGTHRRADYPNLEPGDYVFRVKGSNSDGVWNEEGTAVRITIAPPIWQRWWFRGIVLLGLVGVALGGYRLRVRSLKARSRELERQVRERTYEIEQRRRVAEGLRDIVTVLNSHRPLGEILQYIVAQASRLQSSRATVLHHIKPDEGFVAIEASYGLPEELAAIEGYPLYATRMDELILSRQPFIQRDTQQMQAAEMDSVEGDPRAWQWLAAVRHHFCSVLAVPLSVEDEVYGCIAFYYTEPQGFPQEEIGLAVAFADQAALAIENARLRGRAEETAVTAERNRLARDMHDSVTQSLFSLTLLAEAGQRMIKARDLEQIADNQDLLREIARQALQEMRLMVYELRPPSLKGKGLIEALEHRLEAVERRAGVDARLIVKGTCDLPARVEEELYRIAHEALNNALKHANPSAVSVTFRAEDGTTVLEVQDDGRGFDSDAEDGKGGLGMVSMQERAEKIGGRLTVHSAPGQGTRVRLVVSG